MIDFEEISQQYNKFLIEVKFNNSHYFAVFGADKTDNDVDKLLINEVGNFLLFPNRSALSRFILDNGNVFDKENTRKWAGNIQNDTAVNYLLDLDVFKCTLNLENEDLFNTLYTTIGLVEDYAKQANNEPLLSILNSDAISTFNDEMSDYFLWSKSNVLNTSIDLYYLSRRFKNIHKLLEFRIKCV